ncbi:MAG: hypothetical protein V4619_15445 [Bacteroidota bacterium]
MKNFNNFYKAAGTLLLVAFMGLCLAAYFGINPALAAVGLFMVGLIPRPANAFFMATPDTTNIANYFGKVAPRLFATVLNKMDIAKDIPLITNVKNKLKLTRLIINGEPKPYTGVHNAQDNDIAYSGRDLVVDAFQRDLLIMPSKYRLTYLSDFRDPGEGTNNKSIPFVQFTYNRIVEEQAAAFNNKTAFFGVGTAAFAAYSGAATYAVGDLVTFTTGGELQYWKAIATTSAGQSPDTHPAKWLKANALAITKGLGTILKADRANSVIPAANVASTGAITGADALAQVKAIWRKLPDAVKAQGAEMNMARTIGEYLLDDIETKLSKYTEKDNSGTLYLPGTDGKCAIKIRSWMSGSGMVFATPRENLMMGTDLLTDLSTPTFIPDVYTIKGGYSGVMGFNYQDENVLAINDQN